MIINICTCTSIINAIIYGVIYKQYKGHYVFNVQGSKQVVYGHYMGQSMDSI
jgi:hypothetical protein